MNPRIPTIRKRVVLDILEKATGVPREVLPIIPAVKDFLEAAEKKDFKGRTLLDLGVMRFEFEGDGETLNFSMDAYGLQTLSREFRDRSMHPPSVDVHFRLSSDRLERYDQAHPL